MKILIVDDNKILNNNISSYLKLKDINSKQLFLGEKVLFELSSNNYDAIILDIGLPDIDGLEVCKKIREKGLSIPILMLTARSTTSDKINGLNHGADDYLTKPFDYEELLARLNSLIRRNFNIKSKKINLTDSIKIDIETKEVFNKQKNINLSRLEFKLLEYLAKNKGKIISKEKLLEKVWGEFDAFSNSRTTDVYIGYLRKKLGKELIETKRGQGYIIN